MNPTTAGERWRNLANLRQGIISKLERKLDRAEAEITSLTESLSAANARLAMYDQREAA
ncbi:hypothetical protein [Arthrobacter sp. R4-81]